MPDKWHINNKKSFLALLGVCAYIIYCLVDLKAIYWAALDYEKVFSWDNSVAFLLYFLVCIASLIILSVALVSPKTFSKWIGTIRLPGWLRWTLSLSLCLFPVWFFSFSSWGLVFISPALHGWCLISVVILVNWLTCNSRETFFSFETSLRSILLTGGFFLIGNRMKEVVDYPFSLYWSEGNRFWDYSLLFARHKYIYPADQPIFAFIDLGRQSLWGLPFLLDNVSITLMRFWNVFLFSGIYVLFGFFIFKRKNTPFTLALLLGLWTFIFLNQGPIYAPLIICAMLVWLAAEAPLLITFLLLTAAGYYAHLTRYTWSIAPAIWGVLLALFHTRQESSRFLQTDWVRIIVSGLAGILGGLVLPVLVPLSIQGVLHESQTGILTSATTTLQAQPLIWSRLLPNETYAPGILLGILIATLPLILLLNVFRKQTGVSLTKWQLIVIWGSCLAFLIAGLIASIKIGGGSNLHNLDMFFINLLLLTGIAWKCNGREWLLNFRHHSLWIKFLILFLVAYPLFPAILTVRPYTFPSSQEQKDVLAYIQKSVREAKNIGEVLFIDQRQLLTFGEVRDVPLVPEYEKKYLMNQAMSGDKELFNEFYTDLRSHRFSLIINEPSFINYQTEDYEFGTENNVWVEWVAKPLSCYYRPLKTFKNVKVELLIPRVIPPDPTWNCP